MSGDQTFFAKIDIAKGYQASACFKCSNGQNNVTWDGFTISQSEINFSDFIYPAAKSKKLLKYDANGNIATVSTSTYYSNNDAYNYSMHSATFYEQGCQQPISSADNKLVYLDGIHTIKLRQDAKDGYKIRVCIKFDFYEKASSLLSNTKDVVYSITNDNILV